jgi:hypothetical protein
MGTSKNATPGHWCGSAVAVHQSPPESCMRLVAVDAAHQQHVAASRLTFQKSGLFHQQTAIQALETPITFQHSCDNAPATVVLTLAQLTGLKHCWQNVQLAGWHTW